jgi:hypothetical protein
MKDIGRKQRIGVIGGEARFPKYPASGRRFAKPVRGRCQLVAGLPLLQRFRFKEMT